MRRAVTPLDALLALFRSVTGAYWLYEQHWKLPPDFGLHDARGLMFAFRESVAHPTISLYGTVVEQVVIPHFHLFGWLLLLTEVVIGLSLLLGARTKLGALIGVLQAVNLLVAQARTPEGPWIYLAILAANTFVLLTPSNRAFSIDSWRAHRASARDS
ncbi:MAG: hypothetical protein ABI664_17745 [bacterium]